MERREFKTIKGMTKRGLTLRKMSLLIFINRERRGVSESCLPDMNTGIEIFKRWCRPLSRETLQTAPSLVPKLFVIILLCKKHWCFVTNLVSFFVHGTHGCVWSGVNCLPFPLQTPHKSNTNYNEKLKLFLCSSIKSVWACWMSLADSSDSRVRSKKCCKFRCN